MQDLPPALLDDDPSAAAELVARYFDTSGSRPPYTGAFFERLGGGGDRLEVRDRITGTDVVAVSLLSVDIPGPAVSAVHGHAEEIRRLLRDIPVDLDLVDAEQEVIAPGSAAWTLWDLLNEIEDIGWVTANKLLARKRPRLLPVYDSVVRDVLGHPDGFWSHLRSALSDDDGALHQRLLAIRDASGVGDDISPLRIFDVTCWMIGQRQHLDADH